MAGSAAADFTAFYEANRRRLVAQLIIVVGDRREAEDAAQEAFLRAWRRWPEVARCSDAYPWVFTVAHRVAISRWRRAQVAVKTPAGEVSLDKLTGPLDVAFGDQVVIEADDSCRGMAVATQSGPGLDDDPIEDQLLHKTQPGSQALVASQAGSTTLRLIDNSACGTSTQCAGTVVGSLTINVPAAPATAGGTVLEQIRGFLGDRTDLPVRLPTRLPGVAAGNSLSARATADRTSDQIRLYDCGASLPLNDPGIGNLVGGRDCGGEAATYGSFDAEQLTTPAAAQEALSIVATNTPTTPQCPGGARGDTSSATLGNVIATVLSCPEVTRVTGPEVQVAWTQRGWTVMLLDGGETSFTAPSSRRFRRSAAHSPSSARGRGATLGR